MDVSQSQSPATSEICSRHASAYESSLKGGHFLLGTASFQSGRISPPPPQRRIKLSSKFKRLLAVATVLPLIALILIICSTFTPQWERVDFEFDKVLQFACSNRAKDLDRSWSLAYLVIEGGRRIHVDGETHRSSAYREACRRLLKRQNAPPSSPLKKNVIVGMGIFDVERNATHIGHETTLTEVYNILGGVFRVCYETRGMLTISYHLIPSFMHNESIKHRRWSCYYILIGAH